MSNLSYWQERHFNCLLDKDNSGVSQSSKLVGRRAELDELIKLSTQFEDNRPQSQFVLLTGDAGIGKSALLSEFAGRARADDALVLFGKATRGSGNMPFNAFADAFEDHDELIQTTAATVATRHCQEFAAVFPALAGNSHGSGDQVTARLSYDGRRAFRELFERLAAAKLVLILDDFHAADPASVELAASMLRRPPDAPMLFLLSCRKVSSELQSAIDRRHQQAGITHIHLRPLSEQHVEEMLADRGTTIWRKELYRGSGGNPAYVKSLIAERPLFSANQDPSIQHLGTASGYHAMFLCDLDGVEAEVRTVAGAAAVVGHDFEVVLVAQILNQPEGAVLEAIDELIKRDVVHHVGHGQFFTFRHPAVYRAVYGGIELSRRVQMHAHADDLLQARGMPPSERAPHVAQVIKHGDLDAIALLEAAARAVAATDPGAATAWLTTGLRALPQLARFQRQRAGLLVQLARAQGASGLLRECRDTIHAALPIIPKQEPVEHAKAVALATMVQRLLGAHAETNAMLHAEIEALGAEDTVASAVLKYELAAQELHYGDIAKCCYWAQEALIAAQRHHDRCLETSGLGLLAKAHIVGGDTKTAAAYLLQAATILDGMVDGEFVTCLDAVAWIGWSEILLERWDDASRHFEKAVELATRTNNRLMLPHLLVCQMYVLRTRGRLAEGWAAAEHALYLAEQADSTEYLAIAYSMQSWLEAIFGRFERATESDLIATRLSQDSAGGWCQTLALRFLAESRLMVGDYDGALALVAALGGPDLPPVHAQARINWCEIFTRAEMALGRPDAAAEWAEAATAAAAELDQPGKGALALLTQVQVLLARDPKSALTMAEQAVAGLELGGLTLDALRARVALGIVLWHQDRYDDAVRELKDTELALEKMGATTLARLARTERRRLTGRSSRTQSAASGNGHVLTGREQQVADLVQGGLTNRQIAKRLHIAEKTVEMHLSNVFAKLGVSNRAAVAAFVTREQPETDIVARR